VLGEHVAYKETSMGIDNDISRSSTLLLDVKNNNGDIMNTEELAERINNTTDGFKLVVTKDENTSVSAMNSDISARDVVNILISKGWTAPAITQLTDMGATLLSPDKKIRLNVIIGYSSISFNWFEVGQ
jgi:hypothetical protein